MDQTLLVEIINLLGEKESHYIVIPEGSEDDEQIKLYMDDEVSGEDINSSCSYTIEGVQ